MWHWGLYGFIGTSLDDRATGVYKEIYLYLIKINTDIEVILWFIHTNSSSSRSKAAGVLLHMTERVQNNLLSDPDFSNIQKFWLSMMQQMFTLPSKQTTYMSQIPPPPALFFSSQKNVKWLSTDKVAHSLVLTSRARQKASCQLSAFRFDFVRNNVIPVSWKAEA